MPNFPVEIPLPAVRPPVRRRRPRPYYGLTFAGLVAGSLLGGLWLSAHEGHGTPLKPRYRELRAGDATYRVGLAVVPEGIVVGEDVRFEFQLLRFAEPRSTDVPGEPVTSSDLQVRIISTDGTPHPVAHVGPGEKPGTYTARYRFDESGQYGVGAQFTAPDGTVGTEFPVAVASGPIVRTVLIVDAIVLLLLGAFAFSRWRAAQQAGPERSIPVVQLVGLAVVGVAVLAAGHMWFGPQAGRLFLPERHFAGIAWDMGVAGGDAPAVSPPASPDGDPDHTHPPGTPPHTHSPPSGGSVDADTPGGPFDIVSTVVPVPGRLLEVRVPASARVLFEGFTPRVGRAVRRGQTLATLEYNYVLHDAVHMVNQRWLYLMPMLAARRASLEAELTAARLHYLAETGDPSVRQALDVTGAIEAADQAAATARLEAQRAEKLLGMHTAEIGETQLVRRAIRSPINGTIEAVNFTHGQLMYENDVLFTILDLSRVWVEVRFPEEAAAQKPLSRLHFTSPAFPGRQFEGRLARVARTLDPETGTLSAFFEVANRARLLRIGMRLATEPPANAAATSGVVRQTVAFTATDPVPSGTVSVPAVVKPKPELSATVVAPLWGRLQFADRPLAVGDYVKKGEPLANVVLELSADERYQMNSRAADIAAERELSRVRRERAEARWREADKTLRASPDDPFRQREVQLLERMLAAAKEEEQLLVRQVEIYKDVMKRRDPKTTVVEAPISGVITEVAFRPGELNGTDEFRRLFTIVNTSEVWLEAAVYGPQTAAVLTDFKMASFTSPALRSQRSLDRPIAVTGRVNPDTGALGVVFDVPNPNGSLKLGASALITVQRD